MFRIRTFALALLGVATVLLGSPRIALAADHLDSPSVEADGRLDINDLYVFRSPTNPANAVFVVTVNPFAGVMSPLSFNPGGRYEINVDQDLDARADVTFRIDFDNAPGSRQDVVVRQDGQMIGQGSAGQTMALQGGGRFRADVFDDPFFFDLNGFENDLQFTGDDFFEGAFTSAIVLEVPVASLGATKVGVWARTMIQGEQFDRMGRPAITTATLKADATKNRFNLENPVGDFEQFGAEQTAAIAELLGGDRTLARDISCLLLPDLLTVDFEQTTAFPNGRDLPNDVIDVELTLLSNGALRTDMVDSNDRAFSSEFPYLAETREKLIDRRPLGDQSSFYVRAAFDAAYQTYLSEGSEAAYYAYLYAYYALLYQSYLEQIDVRYFDDRDLRRYVNLRSLSLEAQANSFVFAYYYVFLPSGGTIAGSYEAAIFTSAAYETQLDDLQSLIPASDR